MKVLATSDTLEAFVDSLHQQYRGPINTLGESWVLPSHDRLYKLDGYFSESQAFKGVYPRLIERELDSNRMPGKLLNITVFDKISSADYYGLKKSGFYAYLNAAKTLQPSLALTNTTLDHQYVTQLILLERFLDSRGLSHAITNQHAVKLLQAMLKKTEQVSGYQDQLELWLDSKSTINLKAAVIGFSHLYDHQVDFQAAWSALDTAIANISPMPHNPLQALRVSTPVYAN